MSIWHRFADWLRQLLGLAPSPVLVSGEGGLQPLRPRVLLITFNPKVQSRNGQQLSRALGWYDVEGLVRDFIADVRECSAGLVEFEVVERIEVDAWPAKVDGFRYDADSFLASWHSRAGWHELDAVDYDALISDFQLLNRVESGQIDEVWMFGFPYAGFYESIMVGPEAFWCNAPPIVRTNGISRRFVIMGFNYERDVGPMLESLGHRVESHLKHAWRHHVGEDNLWERFIRYDKIAPGGANCGWMHYAPNSQVDYDWGNPTQVLSNCDDWLQFPAFSGRVRLVDCREWGNGDMRAHHKWWFKHLPKTSGDTRGLANNWWLYGIDANAVR